MNPSRCALLTTLCLCLLSTRARAGDQPLLTLFVGSGHGADAQLHPALPPIHCYDCKPLAVPRYSTMQAPSLATVGVGYAGTSGWVRGGIEAFTVLAVGSENTSAYTGAVTFAGIDQGWVYAVAGLGLAKFIGTLHRDTLSSFALNGRAELGVHLMRGWSVSVRTDVIYNDISSSRVVTFGLGWTPSLWSSGRLD